MCCAIFGRNCCCNFRGNNCSSNNCCNFRSNCCPRCCCNPCRCNCSCTPQSPRTFNASGEAWTTGIQTWDGIEEVTIPFDGFKLENMLSADGDTALVVQRSGCYELEYLVTVSDFDTSDGGYTGIDVVMAKNGTLLSPAMRVDPTGAFDFPAVATDKRTVQLERGDKITLMLRATAEGDVTVTPSAWLTAERIRATC